jgi:mannose-1-phosphate guanylyltransferase
MQALILAGGKGTRLRPLTVYTPKPIVSVLNRPFLIYQLEILRRAGVKDIVLSLNYQPDKIEHLLGDGSQFGVNLRYITEPSPMGTAGAYKYAAKEIRETTIVLNGDVLTDLDITAVIEAHKNKQAEATIVLTPVENPAAYGLVGTENNLRIKHFLEKPSPEELSTLTTKNINAGIYIIEPSVLDLIPGGENYSFEYKLFPDLLAGERSFYGFVMDKNYWQDIGTPKSYLQAHHDFLSGKIVGFDIDRTAKNDVSHIANVDKTSVLAEDCVIKPNAKIINSVIGKGVQIEERTVIENSVIHPHTRITSGSQVRGAIIGRSCYIGKNCIISEGAVLGDKTSLTDYTQV